MRDCFVAVAPRNDSVIFFSVIASEAKQSQALWFHRELLMRDLLIKESALAVLEKHCKNYFNQLFQNRSLKIINMNPIHDRTLYG
jgi:hypothetical protein